MRIQPTSATEDVPDNQILVLLQHHRRLTFLTLADALPMYTWQSLFAALNRLRHREQVEMMALPADYEVVWRPGRDRARPLPANAYQRV
ncbi:MAG TPA: hypothetical protein PKV55_15855 [Nitrospira sp.]|nr:hypothetical protein [Nitrospira sp.]MBS0162023.1 hypothetical protein [Nitrospira sp.]MBS0174863.1 hypothetical protein [Nitrospira sp.]MBS0178173.1 hypothetical protein [Nitrospira sp.]MBX3339525.1 hypothetical protein [Nitrospira sp.]